MKILLISLVSLLLFISLTAAQISVSDVELSELNPGEETTVRITIENTFDQDIEDISFTLNFAGLPLSPVGSSETSIDEIEDDDEESIAFRIRASPTAEPGDYQVPYTLSFGNGTRAKTGTIGVRVKGTVELALTVDAENPVVGQQGRLSAKLINKGFADARYVSITLVPDGLDILSEDTLYIGDISANDFESATFDVMYTSKNPVANVLVEYRDFSNVLQRRTFTEEVQAYTHDEAVKKGIIQKSNAPLYVSLIVILLVLWIIWRTVRKRRKMKRSMQGAPAR